MASGQERLAEYWRLHHADFVEDLYQTTVAHAGPSYRQIDPALLRQSISDGAALWQRLFETGDAEPMLARAKRLGESRAAANVGIGQVMRTSDLFREAIWRMMHVCFGDAQWDLTAVEQIEHWLHDQRNAVVAAYGDSLNESLARLAEREQELASQTALIRDLSAPIVPIYEGILVVPLVGALTAQRTNQIVESVLQEIVERQADVLIIDITGVPVIDTSAANHLLMMIQAIRLIGADVALVGISAEIAQTIVQLGIDIGGIAILANLQSGIAHALAHRGFAIRPVQNSS
jgi:rsbT co-antagonist protein RsbR